MLEKIEMSESDFIKLTTELASSEACTGDMVCLMSNTQHEETDCANCWTKRLSKIIKC